jgi:hypothetical protein
MNSWILNSRLLLLHKPSPQELGSISSSEEL